MSEERERDRDESEAEETGASVGVTKYAFFNQNHRGKKESKIPKIFVFLSRKRQNGWDLFYIRSIYVCVNTGLNKW